jgi:uncharacterized protein YjbI with pentapeptide repeats
MVLTGVDLSQRSLARADFSNVNLANITLDNTNIYCTDLRGTGLTLEDLPESVRNKNFAIYNEEDIAQYQSDI